MQKEFPFLSVMPAPIDAPQSLVVRISCKEEAAAVSVCARDYKQLWYATQLGVSEAYISLILSGKRSLPAWMVEPLCVLTGSNLIKQYLAYDEYCRQMAEQQCAKRAISQLAQELRKAA